MNFIDAIKTPFVLAYRGFARLARGKGLRSSRLILKIDHMVRSRLRLSYTVVDGHKLYLDDCDSLNLSIEPEHEGFENRLLDACTDPGAVVLDVGGNIGFNTLRFARAVGPGGKVYAFEPEPGNLALLRRNVAANGYLNVTVVPKAVADAPGALKLYISETNRGDHRLYESDEKRAHTTVPVVRIDDELRDVAAVSVIKIDIQGSELRALTGMRELLQRSSEVIVVSEFWPYGISRSGGEARRYLESLRTCGFSTILEVDEKRNKLVECDDSALLSKFAPGNQSHTNIVAIKGDRFLQRIKKLA